MSIFRLTRRALGLGVSLSLAAWWISSVSVQAQHTPDPYNIVGEFNRQYEPYMLPTEPNGSGVFANQNRLEDRGGPRGSNRYQQFIDESDGADGADAILFPGRSRSGGGAMSDAQAARAADLARSRMYRPNAKADKDFYSDQRERDLRFFEAMGQTDPAKRAQMLREFRSNYSRTNRGPAGKAKASARDTRRGLDADDSRLLDPIGSEEEDEMSVPRAPGGLGPRRSTTQPGAGTRSRPSSLLDPASRLNRPDGSATSARSSSNPRAGANSTTNGRAATSPSSSAKPSDVLRRSRTLDRDASSSGPIDPRTLDAPPR